MSNYNPYQKMHYDLKYGSKSGAERTAPKIWDLLYDGKNIVIGANYAVCVWKRNELKKEGYNIKLFSIKPHK